MSLERQTVHVKLDPEIHSAMKAICEARGIGLGDFIEEVASREVKSIVHDAIMIADAVSRAGIFGRGRENQGAAGKAGDRL